MPVGGGSIQVMRLFGIRIGVSASWFVVLFLMIFLLSANFQSVLDGSDTQAYLVAVGAALLFYVSLVFHELGHALVARRQGIEVERIDLWFFGGLAQLRSEPRSPGAEFAVAIAGPIVTLLVAIACALAASLVDSSSHFIDAATLRQSASASPAYVLLPAARGAIAQGTMRHQLLTVTVADVMDPDPVTIDGETTLLEARERIFDPHGWPFVGVVDRDNRFLGVLTRDELDTELAA